MTPSNHRSSLLPVSALLLGATLWGVLWYPLRWLEVHGLAGLWTSLIINAAALLLSVPLLVRRRGEFARAPMLLFWLMLVTGFCNTAFVLAVIEGAVVRVLLLFYLAPVWAALLGWWLLGERPSRMAWGALGLAMSGALVMLWNPALGLPWPQHTTDWLAIASGASFALSNVLVRKMGDVSVPVKTGVVWGGGVALAALWIGYAHTPLPVVTPDVFFAAVALGMLGITLMTLAVQYGVTHLPVHRSAVILQFELVVGAVSSAWLAHESLGPREWIGGLMIVAAAWLSIRSVQRP